MNSGILTFFKENKRARLYILLLFFGVLILFFAFSLGRSQEKGEADSEYSLDEYARELEERVASLCSSVEGVGKCKVYLTFQRGEQSSYKGSALIETKPPQVLGVTVICRGGDSLEVRRALTEMLTALFNIGTNRVAILKLNS